MEVMIILTIAFIGGAIWTHYFNKNYDKNIQKH